MKKSRLIVAAFTALLAAPALAKSDFLVYFGTYTNTTSKGIYVADFDSETGKLDQPRLAVEAKDPSFVVIHPSHRYLYAVNENGARVLSYSIDKESGKLTPINNQPSGGDGPCHVSVDHTGKVLMDANYNSGHVASYPIRDDGSIGAAASVFLQGPASHATPGRQDGPHAHSINADLGNHYALACDLGCDKIFVYRLDPQTAKLTPNEPPFVAAQHQGGPRHLSFHPSGKFVYANNEISCTLASFTYDGEKGVLTPLEVVSTLPKGVKAIPDYSTAETLVHPNGKWVYVSNRGHDSLAQFEIDQTTGQAKLVAVVPALVKTPRNFRLDPSGRWLIAAGQDSNTVSVFSIDPASGALKPTGQIVNLAAPVCVRFLKR